MKITGKPCTLEEFERLIELPENADERLEWIAGMIYQRIPHSAASVYTARIAAYLGRYVFEHNLGHLLSARAGYVIGGGRLMPNLSYVTGEHFETLSDDRFMTPAPDFALETINPFENVFETYLSKKISSYWLEKIPLHWFFYPERQEIDVYVHGKFSQTADIDDKLFGDDTLYDMHVFPGFELAVKDIFQ